MKTKIQIMLAAVALTFAVGCASSSKTKPVYERGWIGSDFQKAGRELRPKGERAAVYVRQVYTNTPSAQAGLQMADLIVALDGEAITRMRDFRARVDAAKPGQVIKLTVLRDGERVELPVKVGRERYQNWHTLQFGLALSSQLDLLPTPNFNVLSMVMFKRETDRLELNSPESILKRNASKSSQADPEARKQKEGWRAWLGIFGLGKHKTILSQEPVEALTAQR